MVLGLGSKKKGATVKVEFQIQLQEIKPWRADAASGVNNVPLLVHWERGDNRSGRTRGVVPKQEDGGKLVFNETFRLPAKLVREPPGKGRNAAGIARFQKKTMVFILQEATTDRQLARCVLDLADYGDLQSSVPASIPLVVGKKSATGGGPTPSLFLTIGPLGKEEKTFTARVSFGSSTPRNSISKAPEKTVSVGGKSRVEPALDEDTRRSIVAALMSDDDDNISIESFTDDESTPEDATPRSGKASEAPTPEREMPKTSIMPPKADVPKRPVAGPETIPKPVNKSSSSSSSSSSSVQPAEVKTHTEGPTNKAPTKNVPSKPMRSLPESVATDETVEKSRHVPAKPAPGKAAESSTISSPEIAKSSPPPPASTPSVTQLFSSVPVYKSSKVADGFSVESAARSTKTLPDNPDPPIGLESHPSKGIKQKPSPEQRDEALRATLATDVSSNGGSSSSKANKALAPSPECPQIVASKVTDGTRSSGSSAESKRPGEIPVTESPRSPIAEISAKKLPSLETAKPSPPAQVKATAAVAAAAAAAASAASAYVSSRPYRSFEGSSHDYVSDPSEDSLSESSTSGRSPAQTPLRDQPQVSGRSVSSAETAVEAKHRESSEAVSRIGSNVSVPRDGKRDESKPSPSKSPDVKKDVDGGAETKREVAAEKHEESAEQGESVLGSARANLARMEKRALEELRTKIANAEAKLLAESQKVEKLQGELRDLGAMEVSLYTVVAEHGSSTHKLHTPARRLARLYMYAYKNWSSERRAGTVKNSVLGLVTVAKSCGSDVSRLSFWWSNVVALRAVITQAFDKGASSVSKGDNALGSPVGRANGNGSLGWARARRSVGGSSFARRASTPSLPTTPKSPAADWKEASAYIAALEKIEDWIYSKIVESLWWQAMMPRMQKDVDASTPTSPKGMAMLTPSPLFGSAKEDLSKLAGDVSGIFVKKPSKRAPSLSELGDSRQGTVSVEVWKKAILDALRRLCPVRGAGHDCGCLPMLIKMALEGCVARLDVALFNAILREPDDDVPTDPYSDPVSDSSVLPIAPGGLTFGGGSQLKNVVVTWSTFIAGLVNVKDPVVVTDSESGESTDASDDADKMPRFFHLIKATGDLLMLPKEILMDKGIRKEICPMLSLPLIRRVLVNFVPDEFAPDPISPSLLAALNAEASIEKQRQGEAESLSSSIPPMAEAPPVVYVAPLAENVWPWIGETSADPNEWGRSNSSLLRKGYTSDEDLSVMEQLQKSSASSKLEVLLGSSMQGTANGKHPADVLSPKKLPSPGAVDGGSRFELLKDVWGVP